MAWARYYLVQAGLLDSSQRGIWTLTDAGRRAGDLTWEESSALYREVRELAAAAKQDVDDAAEVASEDDGAPEDTSEDDGLSLQERVIVLLKAMSPSGFERFCQRLLRESGFQQVEVTGRAGDGGIDGMGILRVNTLVSFKVLFQCKRYAETVGPSIVRDFRGAMAGRADKGIILTTGRFTADARRESIRDGAAPIELVDGEALVGMLEELQVGLIPTRAFRIDEGFFGSFDAVLGE